MESVSWNGTVLTNSYTVIAQKGMPSYTVAKTTIPNMDGVLVGSVTQGCPTFKLTFVLAQGTAVQREAERRQIAAMFDVDGPRQLALGRDDGAYYMAVPSGNAKLEERVTSGKVVINLMVTDPAAYGQTKTATVPSGGSVTITVGGNSPTFPTIYAASAVRNSTSLVWGVKLEDGTFVHVPTGTSSSRRIDIDCGKRTSTITANATVNMPTLDSDWLVLTPGTHTVTMDQGTGAATLTWVERWV